MSATHRGSKIRHPDDFYRTPSWCVESLLPVLGDLSKAKVLEPCCGDGAILSALPKVEHLDAVEIDEGRLKVAESTVKTGSPRTFHRADFLKWVESKPSWGPRFDGVRVRGWDLVIGNPPFKLAMEFVQASTRVGYKVAFILRLPWLASQKRAEWLRANPPALYVLPKRPQFAMFARCVRASKERKAFDLQEPLPYECGYVSMLGMEDERPVKCPRCDSRVHVTTSDATDYAWFVWEQSVVRKHDVNFLHYP